MTDPVKLNFKIYQGSTFGEVLRWESAEKVYKTITAVTQSAPVVITAIGHGIPADWRVKVTNVVGMTDINTTGYVQADPVTTDTLKINNIVSVAFKPYVSGGVLEYNKPVDMTGFTGKMQIRPTVDSATILHELTTENGGIVIDNVNKKITLNIPAATTAAFTFSTAVYGLEVYNSSGSFILTYGNITLIKEVVR